MAPRRTVNSESSPNPTRFDFVLTCALMPGAVMIGLPRLAGLRSPAG